jgi:hypothetical protein
VSVRELTTLPPVGEAPSDARRAGLGEKDAVTPGGSPHASSATEKPGVLKTRTGIEDDVGPGVEVGAGVAVGSGVAVGIGVLVGTRVAVARARAFFTGVGVAFFRLFFFFLSGTASVCPWRAVATITRF